MTALATRTRTPDAAYDAVTVGPWIGREDDAVPPDLVYRFYSSSMALFDVMREAGRRFDGDYTAWAIYCAFLVSSAADSLRNLAVERRAGALAPGVLSAWSVADMTGIPRETVRRKCISLVSQGLLTRTETGEFRCEIDTEVAETIARRLGRDLPR